VFNEDNDLELSEGLQERFSEFLAWRVENSRRRNAPHLKKLRDSLEVLETLATRIVGGLFPCASLRLIYINRLLPQLKRTGCKNNNSNKKFKCSSIIMILIRRMIFPHTQDYKVILVPTRLVCSLIKCLSMLTM
jgi:hypothetical protein